MRSGPPHRCSMGHRIAAAWATFSKYKFELTNKKYRLRDRLRLFDTAVSASALYGCEAWTLTLDLQRRLQATQRKMLRLVLNARRRKLHTPEDDDSGSDVLSGTEEEGQIEEIEEVLEPWHEFLKRTARWSEEQLKRAALKEWLETWRSRQWKYAAELVTTHAFKWNNKALDWCPLIHNTKPRGRKAGRPKKRWF